MSSSRRPTIGSPMSDMAKTNASERSIHSKIAELGQPECCRGTYWKQTQHMTMLTLIRHHVGADGAMQCSIQHSTTSEFMHAAMHMSRLKAHDFCKACLI